MYEKLLFQWSKLKDLENFHPILKNVADIRMVDINKYEPAIKRGKVISFPWDNDDGEIQIVHYM